MASAAADECSKCSRGSIENSSTSNSLPEISKEEPVREWSFYSSGFHVGKRCFIDGYYRSNTQTIEEITLEGIIGRSKKVYNTRGGIPLTSEGDKSYHVPEYSSGFHKVGSTLPAINFSRSSKTVCDTFIPLQPLKRKPRISYMAKHKKRLEEEEKMGVVMLSRWKPAQSLSLSS